MADQKPPNDGDSFPGSYLSSPQYQHYPANMQNYMQQQQYGAQPTYNQQQAYGQYPMNQNLQYQQQQQRSHYPMHQGYHSNQSIGNYNVNNSQPSYGMGAQVGVSYPVPSYSSSPMSNANYHAASNAPSYGSQSMQSLLSNKLGEQDKRDDPEKTGQKREYEQEKIPEWNQQNERIKKRSRYEEPQPEKEELPELSEEEKSEDVVSEVEVVWPEDARLTPLAKEKKEKASAPLEAGEGAKEAAPEGGEATENDKDASEAKEKADIEAAEGKDEPQPEAKEDKMESEDSEEDKYVRYSRVLLNGATYSVGDTVALWPPSRRKGAPMGTIKSLLSDGESNNMEIEWFYRPEETILKGARRQKVPEREVFLSSHVDLNAIEAIQKKVSVKWDREIGDIDEYVKDPDCFYYTRKYDYKNKVFKDL